jgi:hypothetical protein
MDKGVPYGAQLVWLVRMTSRCRKDVKEVGFKQVVAGLMVYLRLY